MLKVFLVEDEFVVREGIKKKIDWEAHGYEFCGEASDGEVAFPMIQKLKPDIVITDIMMPFMDGLELSKLIKKELPGTEIIILTGYEKFEYAKEAIKIGIAEFLSKPISGNELLQEVDALAEKIYEKRKEQEMEESTSLVRKDLLQYLVTASKSLSELHDICAKLKVDISALCYNLVLFDAKISNHNKNEYSKSLIEIDQRIKELEQSGDFIMFDRNLEGKAFLFKADSKEELLEKQKIYLARMEAMMEEYTGIQYFGGVGEPVNRLSELPLSFEKASRAFAHRYLLNENMFFFSDTMENSGHSEKETFKISSVDTKQLDRAKIKAFLKVGVHSEVVYFVEEFFNNLTTSAMESNIFRQYITMDAYFSVVDFVESLQLSKEEIEPFDMESGIIKDAQSAMNYMVQIINQALEMRERVASNKYDDVVDEIMRYIEENYANEELSLNHVAAHVNFSPNHLSTVFSQQTGQTLVKYLTDYRMNKAKELLRCSNEKSSVIAQQVGYKDPHYFSYIFKKTQNMTPTQYRGKRITEGAKE